MELSRDFKLKVQAAIIAKRVNHGGSDEAYAKSLGINPTAYNRIKNGQIDKIISESKWLTIGRELDVKLKSDAWKIARTAVYNEIESNLHFCQQLSKSMILVDDCGIGKTFCAKHVLKNMKNAFYLDCSQSKTTQLFVRSIAKTVGVDPKGKYSEVKSNLKYYLNLLENPLIVLDEAGDLTYPAFLELKELWNGTDGTCGWYMMGADGLRSKIDRGINGKKVGYAEIFSRFSDEYIRLVPVGKMDKNSFYQKLISEVASVNVSDKSQIKLLVNKCMTKEATLRYLETLIKVAA